MGYRFREPRVRKFRTLAEKGLQGKYGNVVHWAVGITIAPRKLPTYTETIDSVIRTGWTEPHLFCEPNVILMDRHRNLPITERKDTMGCWKNWYQTAKDLVDFYPEADAYAIFQDDVIFCLGVRSFLEKCLWPVENPGVISVFTPSHYKQDRIGWHKTDKGHTLWMAQTFIFTPKSIRNMINHPVCVNWKGDRNVDNVIGNWARQTRLFPYYHTPSLAQHIGTVSTIWTNNPKRNQARGRKAASDFVGETYDVSEGYHA